MFVIKLKPVILLFSGVGFCAVLVAFYVSFYYNVIIAWALYFLTASATPDLPWIHCNNTWNTAHCWENAQIENKSSTNITSYLPSQSDNDSDIDYSVNTEATAADFVKNRYSPASEYFQ